MLIYIHIYIHIHTYIHTVKHRAALTRIIEGSTHTGLARRQWGGRIKGCVSAVLWVRVCVWVVCVGVHARVSVCTYVCRCVRTYVCLHLCVNAHAICTHTYAHTHTHTQQKECRVQGLVRAMVLVLGRVCVCVFVRVCVCVYVHTHVYSNKQTHTYMWVCACAVCVCRVWFGPCCWCWDEWR